MEFRVIKEALNKNFQKMQNEFDTLFVINVDKDAFWQTYLGAFSAEDNPIKRVRTEHDCSCCRHFIKNIGNVVAVKDGKIISIWDFKVNDPKWQKVADAMSYFVKSSGDIAEVFLSKFPSVGTDKNRDTDPDTGRIETFEHFYVKLDPKFVFSSSRGRGYNAETMESEKGSLRDIRNVFYRSLSEISLSAAETVSDLIRQNSLYRGEEWKVPVQEFIKYKKNFDKLESEDSKKLFAWEFFRKAGAVVGKIRNHSMGTLLVDISNGEDLDTAVRKYEAIVAPANYKRSTPIYSQRMLDDARKTITELGYMDSLSRRFAKLDDISVKDILFCNRDAQQRVQGAGDVFDQMSKGASGKGKKFNLSKVEEVPIDRFVSEVLPTAESVEVYMEGRLEKNLCSLIAPVVADSQTMFKWGNNFGWAYKGNVTDSMLKQNVKSAGGKVDGVLRFSIQWNELPELGWDKNDEDAHCQEPNGFHIYYGNKVDNRTGGNLDVDIINPERNKPAVENITWPDIQRMKEGTYIFWVRCFSGRGGRSGFRAEIEFDGQTFSYDYRNPLIENQDVMVAEVTLRNGKFSIVHKLDSSESSREVWGINTNEFVPATVICNSPNFWNIDEGVGNKHYMFMLKGCKNPEQPNGWYNEFLKPELAFKHRKVMEAMGYQCHVEDTEDQMSGLGFSSTIRNYVVVKVSGSSVERVVKVLF